MKRVLREWVFKPLLGIAILLLLLVIAYATGLTSMTCWDRWDNSRVTGHLIDARTGEPATGVEILTLWQASDADNELEVESMRAMAQKADRLGEENRAADDDDTHSCPVWGSISGIGLSDADGKFDICSRVHYGGTDYGWDWRPKSRTPPPYHGVHALLITWPDGRTEVLDATNGRYTVVNEAGIAGIYARIDMGVVLVGAE